MRILLFFALLSLRGHAADVIETRKIEIANSLYADGFFRLANCRQVANTFLRHYGLPGVGEDTAVKGRRGRVNRTKEYEMPPELVDEILPEGKEESRIKFTTRVTDQKGWQLLLEHEKSVAGSSVKMATRATFKIEDRKDGPICDMVTMNFSSMETKDKQGKTLYPVFTRDTQDCLDLEMLAEQADASPVANAHLAWIKEDCAVALHYSQFARNWVGAHPKK